ncbi:signal peptidase I [Sporosarcina highlanderae]|uniref:Signal peptidase I n=1 Tax=Sporosarcina highlanderae TaxID=3035916 RepID=A0ABT8JUD6_9BACL|nr:signal peptidase I [Sporosarcina highlanderae]MDN4608778.1 signal peptidase I [Sporosarcina highlanderae]
MKHLSDEKIVSELEQLGEVFRPSSMQKEKMRRQISMQTRPNKSFRIRKLLPTFLSVIVLFSVGFGLYSNLSETGTNNVTASWDGMVVEQISLTSPTHYLLTFSGTTLTIKDIFTGFGPDPEITKEKVLRGYNIKEPFLTPGMYENYSITQNGDTYTLKVDGETGFTYNFEKIGPRILVGEDGVEFSTRTTYLDSLDVITDDVTPERLDIAPQTEHTFLIEWGSDAMDRGKHDFETHEHGKLVVSTDFNKLQRGQPVYYHMPPFEITKNPAIPEMYIGRVVGLPGETVEIKGGQVYIDGKKLDTFYGKATVRGMGEEEYFKTAPKRNISQAWRDYFNMDVAPVIVKENTVYLLVDHWWRGTDSRDFGPLPIEKIEGIILGYEK